MKRLAVIGIGSAGIQALCHYLAWLEGGWEVVSIHDPNIDILGIGESTNPPFYEALQNGLNFNIIEDLEKVDGTVKFAVEYIDWRKHNFLNPLVGGTVAVHINTFKLAEFALPRLRKIWGEKFREITGTVTAIDSNDAFATVTVDGTSHYFDYVMDCRGFPSDMSDYTLFENMPVNHALIHNAPPKSGEAFGPYSTGHTATKNGWMFTVPLVSRDSYGYLFNDNITSVEDARADFANVIGVDESELGDIEYKFSSYFANSIVDGRILKNGNRASFLEPLFANSQWVYSVINKLCFSYIHGDMDMDFVNNEFRSVVRGVESMIAYHYHGGSIYNTDFWKYAKSVSTDKAMQQVNIIGPQLRYFSENNYLPEGVGWVFAPKVLYQIDRNFGYNYFTK